MSRSRVALALGAVLTALSLPAATAAGHDAAEIQKALDLRAHAGEKQAKLDSALIQLAASKAGRLVQVEAIARSGRRAELETAIRAAGGIESGRYGSLVEARIPAGALATLAAHPAARFLRAPARPYPQVVSGEGIAATGASAWHGAQTNGAGVEIAIVDIGFRDWQARQAEGELPQDLETVSFCDGGLFDGPAADNHGTAVAEIVHELAPAAKLHLICIETTTSLGQAKDYVVDHDIPIVNHSIAWLNTSRGDGTGAPGTPAAIVADARANGVLWVNAAGNYEGLHWSGTFSDSDDNGIHNFDGLDEGNDVFMLGGACAFLKWDDWPGSDQDFDLFLLRSSTDEIVDSSTDLQSGSQEPTEAVCADVDDDYYLAIARFSGSEAPRFDLVVTDGDALERSTPGGSVVEPASSPAALAVGAVCVHNNLVLQPYSSRGPTIDGRTKPDVTGPDANSTVAYGPSADCNSGFGGTSASAAHVTAAAALLAQANPGLGPAGLQAALEGKTADLGAPGKDNDWGAGRLALGSAPPTPPAAPAGTSPPAISGLFHQGQTLTASDGGWTSGAALVFRHRWLRCNASGAACAPIPGARARTYVLTATDLGLVLRVRVTAANTGGSAQAVSAGTPAIQTPVQSPANVAAPSLAGAAQVGQSLSASSGAWSGTAPLTIGIEWLRCDTAAEACVVITGATSAVYQLAAEDIGATIRVRVTVTNVGGSATATSSPTAVVLPPAPGLASPPTIAGIAAEGQRLTAGAGSWTFAVSFSFQWRRCTAAGTCTTIPGATSTSYVAGAADAGLGLQVVVTATNAGGTTSAASAPTAAVVRAPGPVVSPPNPPPAGPTAQTRLIVLAFTRTPRQPRAGRTFTVLLRVGTRTTSARGAARRVSCSAKVGTRALRARKSVRGAVARCAWSIPQSAAGKRLRSTIGVSEGARSVRRSVTATVAR